MIVLPGYPEQVQTNHILPTLDRQSQYHRVCREEVNVIRRSMSKVDAILKKGLSKKQLSTNVNKTRQQKSKEQFT